MSPTVLFIKSSAADIRYLFSLDKILIWGGEEVRGRGTAESRGGGKVVGLRRVEGEVRPWD